MPTKKTETQPDPPTNDDADGSEFDPDVEEFAKDWGDLHQWKSDMQAWRDALEQEQEVKRGSGSAPQPGNTPQDAENGQDAGGAGQRQGSRAPRVPASGPSGGQGTPQGTPRPPDTAPKSEHRWFKRLGK